MRIRAICLCLLFISALPSLATAQQETATAGDLLAVAPMKAVSVEHTTTAPTHEGTVRFIAYLSADKIVSCGQDGKIKIIDAESFDAKMTLEGHTDWVFSFRTSADGKVGVSGSRDGTARVWDMETGKSTRTFTGHDGEVFSVLVTKDGKLAITASEDRTIKFWETDSGEVQRSIKAHDNFVRCLAMAPDQESFASSSYDGHVKVWDMDGQLIADLKGHRDAVKTVAFSPSGKYVLSGSSDYTLILWKVKTAELLKRYEGHTNDVRSVDFLPGEKQLVSSSYDGTIRIWNTWDPKTEVTIDGGQPYCVAVSPLMEVLVSAEATGAIKAWDIETEPYQ